MVGLGGWSAPLQYGHPVQLADGTPNTQINKVVCHPTLPIVITGHEDKYIRFFDVNTGKEYDTGRAGWQLFFLSFQGRSFIL